MYNIKQRVRITGQSNILSMSDDAIGKCGTIMELDELEPKYLVKPDNAGEMWYNTQALEEL